MKKSLAFILILCVLAPAALAWETPVIEAPYGWSYEDETRAIVINRVQEGKMTYFVADVQLADASGFRVELDKSMKPKERRDEAR